MSYGYYLDKVNRRSMIKHAEAERRIHDAREYTKKRNALSVNEPRRTDHRPQLAPIVVAELLTIAIIILVVALTYLYYNLFIA